MLGNFEARIRTYRRLTDEDIARIIDNGIKMLGGASRAYVDVIPIEDKEREYKLIMRLTGK